MGASPALGGLAGGPGAEPFVDESGARAGPVEPIEENGFSLLDFTPDSVRLQLFRWTEADGAGAISTLEPFAMHELPRPS